MNVREVLHRDQRLLIFCTFFRHLVFSYLRSQLLLLLLFLQFNGLHRHAIELVELHRIGEHELFCGL